jgi:hypothetical protein
MSVLVPVDDPMLTAPVIASLVCMGLLVAVDVFFVFRHSKRRGRVDAKPSDKSKVQDAELVCESIFQQALDRNQNITSPPGTKP